MKVTIILGSPRLDSNSEKLAKAAAATLLGPGEAPEIFRLNDLRYRGCQACMSCKTKTEVCVLKDDLARVLSVAAFSDFLILTTPIYIGEITAQLKAFIDRSYSWFKPDFVSSADPTRLAPGKKLLFVVTQGNPDLGAYKSNIDAYLGYFGSHGIKAAAFQAPIREGNIETLRPDLLADVVAAAKAL
ncbi:MAG: flavodoxin family protein [Deltaproteobacteria bacterium]|jgi:multimeric flavodoxin WrbA|nr:flavodoxin family protein [Deltaproteobacteria bacterium]